MPFLNFSYGAEKAKQREAELYERKLQAEMKAEAVRNANTLRELTANIKLSQGVDDIEAARLAAGTMANRKLADSAAAGNELSTVSGIRPYAGDIGTARGKRMLADETSQEAIARSLGGQANFLSSTIEGLDPKLRIGAVNADEMAKIAENKRRMSTAEQTMTSQGAAEAANNRVMMSTADNRIAQPRLANEGVLLQNTAQDLNNRFNLSTIDERQRGLQLGNDAQWFRNAGQGYENIAAEEEIRAMASPEMRKQGAEAVIQQAIAISKAIQADPNLAKQLNMTPTQVQLLREIARQSGQTVAPGGSSPQGTPSRGAGPSPYRKPITNPQ